MSEPGAAIGLGILGGLVALDPVKRLLGPTADYLGGELARFTERRMQTIARILQNATDKVADRLDQPGAVPPRVLRDVINDGSWNEDQLSVEYFGGILASSRTPTSRDDRAATFTAMLSRLSTYQIRSHYILYTAIRQAYLGTKSNLGQKADRDKLEVVLPLPAYVKLLGLSDREIKDFQNILEHVVFGLHREDLIGGCEYGHEYYVIELGDRLAFRGIYTVPSVQGCELYLRAHGALFSSASEILKSNLKPGMRELGEIRFGPTDAFPLSKLKGWPN